METLTLQTMMSDVRKVTKAHHKKWQGKWISIDYNDMESETMFWLATHSEQCIQMFSEKGEHYYRGWLKKSLGRLLDRWCQEYAVKECTFVTVEGFADKEHMNDKMAKPDKNYNLTYFTAREALEGGDKRVWELANTACTDRQLFAMKRILLDKAPWAEVKEEMGVTVYTVRFHVDRGIHNIVSKSRGW